MKREKATSAVQTTTHLSDLTVNPTISVRIDVEGKLTKGKIQKVIAMLNGLEGKRTDD